jgi:hypothetical protein
MEVIMKRLTCLLATVLLLAASTAFAQEKSAAELAKAAQNPIANMMSFPFQNNTSFNLGPYDRTQNVLNIQPVLPFADGRLITRTIIPVVWQPEFLSEEETSIGLGDINFTAFYSPESEGVTWGIGPSISFPTGGELRGSQKWGIGPSFVLLTMPTPWVIGFLVNNIWSFAGDEDREDVNKFLAQPFINYNFGKTGWYLSFAPIITANWKATEGNKWIVPLGGTVGKLTRIGKLPLNLQAGAFYNVVKPDWGPEWSTRIQVQFLFPK